jgi:hypothetical protein
MGLYYAFSGPGVPSVCPANGGPHLPISDADYIVTSNAAPGGQPGWEFCNKCAAMFYGNNVAISTCAVHTPTTTHASGGGTYALIDNVPSDPGQHHWRWCSVCQGMWYGDNSGSSCPANPGNPHSQAGSGDYSIEVNPADYQRNWRWCYRCQSLFYASNGAGVCSAGPGGHSFNASASYVFQAGVSPVNTSGPQQTGWSSSTGRYCQACGMMWLGQSSSSRCPGTGGAHVSTGSGVYYLRQTGSNPSPGQTGWKWCSKCQSLWMSSNPGSVCPAGGPHATGNSIEPSDFTLANDTDVWRRCSKCQGLFCWTSMVGVPGGFCPADGNIHSDDGSLNYTVAANLSPWNGSQGGWARCSKCAMLWFGPNQSSSVCPKDLGNHDSNSSASYYMIGTGNGALGETGWKWCSRCQSAWSGRSGSVCPAGGTHSTNGSGDYTLATYTS